MRRAADGARGATLIEVMIALAVVLVGMLGLFRVLSVSVVGSSSAVRFTQAQARAGQILEAIRVAPPAAVSCLASKTADQWATCETTCLGALSGVLPSPQACVFTTLSTTSQDKDRTNEPYFLVYDTTTPSRSSYVAAGGTSGHLYDVQVTIGWNDDNTTTSPPAHRVTFNSAVFR